MEASISITRPNCLIGQAFTILENSRCNFAKTFLTNSNKIIVLLSWNLVSVAQRNRIRLLRLKVSSKRMMILQTRSRVQTLIFNSHNMNLFLKVKQCINIKGSQSMIFSTKSMLTMTQNKINSRKGRTTQVQDFTQLPTNPLTLIQVSATAFIMKLQRVLFTESLLLLTFAFSLWYLFTFTWLALYCATSACLSPLIKLPSI